MLTDIVMWLGLCTKINLEMDQIRVGVNARFF